MTKWKLKEVTERDSDLGLVGGVPPPLDRVLAARGIDTEQQLRLFLNPPQRLPYCPMRLSGMEDALCRLRQATRVGVVGDFDVDGISGTAIMVEGLADFGIEAIPYLPHRVAEGHGLSDEAVHFLSDNGVELILTVDCGVSSIREVELAGSLGIDVIITDHHVPPAVLPRAAANINPAMPGSEYPFPHLCGAGLAYKLVQGLYQLMGRPMPRHLLEMVTLGTIADMVPLLDENRYLVKEGLAQLSQTRRPGLKALFRLARLEEKPITAEIVAFQIAPRLNAAGRMGHAMDSLRLLTTENPDEAETLAAKLEEQNRDRQQLTRRAFDSARSRVESLTEIPPFILVEDPAITPGIAGLVAGQLARKYMRPAVALAQLDGDTLLASGRSIPQFNLVQAFDACADLLERHGGHAQAAGFTIHSKNLGELRNRLAALAQDALGQQEMETLLEIDAEVSLSDLTSHFLKAMAELEPFGVGNPRPLFLSRNLRPVNQWPIGNAEQHLKLMVSEGSQQFPALIFNRAKEWAEQTAFVDLVFTLSEDTWQGRRQVSLMVEDFQPGGGTG
ncbi:MAG: single-stranded-DNA-specific exonuclease RecJ [Chloroflexota bacterium]|nr:single-stranded-DNA-specific exonuclease RecJ [Chloroflexota bacterium]